jgi:hypothetical protein
LPLSLRISFPVLSIISHWDSSMVTEIMRWPLPSMGSVSTVAWHRAQRNTQNLMG